MVKAVPSVIVIEINQRQGKNKVTVRFSKHHDRRHEYVMQSYEESAGITAIRLNRVEGKK